VNVPECDETQHVFGTHDIDVVDPDPDGAWGIDAGDRCQCGDASINIRVFAQRSVERVTVKV
jgi:hypothetical protein